MFKHVSLQEAVSQGLLKNGIQTSGNLFSLDYPYIEAMKYILETTIEKYKKKFKDSDQGFIKNWPKDYTLRSWLLSMKKGGFIKQHNHRYGWITGSFYLHLPKNYNNKNAGNISFSFQGPEYPTKGKLFNSTFNTTYSSSSCILPTHNFITLVPSKVY